MGSKAQAELIFGYDQINTINTTRGAFTITPLQSHAIAGTYSRILQSITKVRMDFLEIQASIRTDSIQGISEWEIWNGICSWTTVGTGLGIQIFHG
jgi:hypothetical protein